MLICTCLEDYVYAHLSPPALRLCRKLSLHVCVKLHNPSSILLHPPLSLTHTHTLTQVACSCQQHWNCGRRRDKERKRGREGERERGRGGEGERGRGEAECRLVLVGRPPPRHAEVSQGLLPEGNLQAASHSSTPSHPPQLERRRTRLQSSTGKKVPGRWHCRLGLVGRWGNVESKSATSANHAHSTEPWLLHQTPLAPPPDSAALKAEGCCTHTHTHTLTAGEM